MTKTIKLLLAGAVSASALLTAAAPVAAQSVAVFDPDAAVVNTNAWKTAVGQIQTTYKAQIDQITARRNALSTQMEAMLKPFDTNNDGQLSPDEAQAAQRTRPTQWQAAEQKQQQVNAELTQLAAPVTRARGYAAEQIADHEDTAVSNVVKARHVALLVRPQAAFYADPTADLTPAVTTELDRLITAPVSISPPANWQPGQDNGGGAPAPAPAPTTRQPQGR